MRAFRYLVIFFLIAAPVASLSALRDGDLPDASKWYFHADFEEMRSSTAGRQLYGWLQDEVFEDIREGAGVDLDKEADFLTAFATEEDGIVLIIEGDISRETEDKVMAMAAAAASGSLDKLGSGSKTFYHVKDDDIDIDSFDDGAFFSFAVNGKLLVTSSQERMQALLDDKGKAQGVRGEKGDLFILRAEQNLVQAGARTDIGDNDWDSNILRNTKQAALLIADQAGTIAIEAQLVTIEAAMADSLASIVRGLISLQMFNDDMDPEIASLLQNATVDVDDTKLTISIAVEPDVIVSVME